MKRRDFFSALAAGAVLLGSGMAISAQTEDTPANSLQLHRQAFEAHLKEQFTLQSVATQKRYQALLESVDGAGRDEQFYLRFAMPEAKEFREDLYLLTAGNGEEWLLHLMPSASDGRILEAVFNLGTPSAQTISMPEGELPSYDDLPLDIMREYKRPELEAHAYDPDPDKRFVLINGFRGREGLPVGRQLWVHEIRADGVVMRVQDRFFFMEH